MKLVELNWCPSDRQTRQFGCICLIALPALAWLWSAGNLLAVLVSGALGALLALTGILAPKWLKPVFVVLTLAVFPIGLVIGELVQLFIFFGLFVPLGLLFRLMGRDPLQRKFDRQASTYWQPKRVASDPASYFRQS